MPQGQRTSDEQKEFDIMLQHINLLFLGMHALVICDMTYASRFWTQFEFWTMMQGVNSSGVYGMSANALENRYSMRCVGNAPPTFEGILISMWLNKSIDEAHEILMSNDVMVTNQHDKTTQLKKLTQLNGACINAWEEMGAWASAVEEAAHRLIGSACGTGVFELACHI